MGVALSLALALLAVLPGAGRAQTWNVPPKSLTPEKTAVKVSSAPEATVSEIVKGQPMLPIDKGPWVLGRILLSVHGQVLKDAELRDMIRGEPGMLYSKTDIFYDVDSLMSMKKFSAVDPTLYEIPGSPVPSEYFTLAASTHEVTLVYRLIPKGESGVPKVPLFGAKTPSFISGLILTPTAYRGTGYFKNPGLDLDINATYIIGRLYGKNDFANSLDKTNYLDRVGVWLLTADGKMVVQSEGTYNPAVAFGAQGAALLRDSPQPTLNSTTNLSVHVSQNSQQFLSDAYWAASKKFGPIYSSVGMMDGDMGDSVTQFSEFLTPTAMTFYANKPGADPFSHTMPFMNLFFSPIPRHNVGLEVIKYNGAALQPWLLNLKAGYFLKLDFNLGFLKFNGGYDILGLINMRYTFFPRSAEEE